MSIQEQLNKIRNAIKGSEVRESIAKGIETAYNDASEKHDNANMEVKLARGTNPNLNTRLNKMDEVDKQTTTQLAQKANKAEVREETNSKPILLNELHTEVKEAMTGGSVAVVGENTVGTENLKDEAVSTSKRTALGEFAIFQVAGDPPNFDFTNRQLVIPAPLVGPHEVIHRNNAYPLPDGEIVIDLNLVGEYSRGFLTFNVKSSSLKTYSTATKNNITENEVMIGVYHLLSKKAYLNCPFLIDGALPSVDSGIPNMLKRCTILFGGGNLPVVDNNAKTLTFPKNRYDTIVYVGDTAYVNSIPKEGVTIDLSDTTGTSAWCILFDTSNKEFVLSSWNQLSNFKHNHALFATFRVDYGKYHFNMPIPFLVDGKLYGFSDATNKVNIIENPMNANVKAVAHRGYNRDAPENTLPAYELAKEKGFSYVEVDIEWTSDNIPVCLHDSTIDRTSNGTGAINDLTLSEARAYDYGSWKSSTYTGTEIPTLEEFIILCKRLNLHPYIELKGTVNESRTQILIDIVKKLGMIDNVSWISFSLTSLENIKTIYPKARLGYVGSISSSMISNAATLKTNDNDVFLDSSSSHVTEALAQECLLADIPLEVWTVNNEEAIIPLVEKGVSGITTDALNVAEIMQGLT